jgi:hypothetical protein
MQVTRHIQVLQCIKQETERCDIQHQAPERDHAARRKYSSDFLAQLSGIVKNDDKSGSGICNNRNSSSSSSSSSTIYQNKNNNKNNNEYKIYVYILCCGCSHVTNLRRQRKLLLAAGCRVLLDPFVAREDEHDLRRNQHEFGGEAHGDEGLDF